MKIIIGSDHAGYKLKEEIKKYLKNLGYEILDYGTNSEESVDYPDIAVKVARDVVKNNIKGILICGSGVGMTITANKIKGVRAALGYDNFTAKASRVHNDANILCLGARVIVPKKAKNITRIWLETNFSNEERHKRRIEKIKKLEN